MRKIFTVLATVVALAFALLAFSGPAAAQAPTTTTTATATSAASTSAADDIEIQVKRMWFPNLTACMLVGAAGVVGGSWDRWFCSPQLLGGWRLYTNR
ncbi:hypothetical protein ACIA5D_47910 [Actinoplanes sp. NPDC051513]|uniref:hypothetical protein n=1 Tax=Actinoplanes sp. NPDC051513 TaxID=3363908 RepID=UPI003796FF38